MLGRKESRRSLDPHCAKRALFAGPIGQAPRNPAALRNQRPRGLEPLPEAILCGQLPQFQISYRAAEEEGIICRLSAGK